MLSRDGYRCIFTGAYDDLALEALDLDVPVEITVATSIIPFTFGDIKVPVRVAEYDPPSLCL